MSSVRIYKVNSHENEEKTESPSLLVVYIRAGNAHWKKATEGETKKRN